MSIDRWMDKDMVYLYSEILLSHKKNEILPFAATRMDLEIIILSEASQTEKDKYHMISLICRILKKKWYRGVYIQNRNRCKDIENKHGYQRGKGERDKVGFGD